MVILRIRVGAQRKQRAQGFRLVLLHGVENRRAAGQIGNVHVRFAGADQHADSIRMPFRRGGREGRETRGRVAVIYVRAVGEQDFDIVVQSRRQATWQGSLFFDGQEIVFQDVLEMIKIIDKKMNELLKKS